VLIAFPLALTSKHVTLNDLESPFCVKFCIVPASLELWTLKPGCFVRKRKKLKNLFKCPLVNETLWPETETFPHSRDWDETETFEKYVSIPSVETETSRPRLQLCFWGYLATSGAKFGVIFLLGDPDFLYKRQNFTPIALSYRDPHFRLFGGLGGFGV